MELDLDSSRFWLELLKVLGGLVAFTLGWWWSRRRTQTAAQERIEERVSKVREDLSEANNNAKEELSAKIAQIRTDLNSLEVRVNELPSHEDMGKVYDRLAVIDGSLHELVGQVGAMSRGVDNMQNYLLNRDRGGQG